MSTQRRNALKTIFATVAGTFGLGLLTKAGATENVPAGNQKKEKEVIDVVTDQEIPFFSQITKFNGMVFIAGQGAHTEGDIKAHTDIVLKALEKQLIAAGSSMEKVLKVTVFLNDIEDYKAMNEVYRGRFGKNPPVRTTVAVAKGGVPGNSLVEMDAIAYI
jgi:enamine deaminase RidA (YjgF/YER057c/UK114 family)